MKASVTIECPRCATEHSQTLKGLGAAVMGYVCDCGLLVRCTVMFRATSSDAERAEFLKGQSNE